MSKPKFQIGQRVKYIKSFKYSDLGTIVEFTRHNPPMYVVTLDGEEYAHEDGITGTTMNDSQIEAI